MKRIYPKKYTMKVKCEGHIEDILNFISYMNFLIKPFKINKFKILGLREEIKRTIETSENLKKMIHKDD